MNRPTDRPMNRPAFNVFEPYDGVIVVTMNNEMKDLLRSFIGDVDLDDVPEKELRAFQAAMADPTRCRIIRAEKGLTTDGRQISALTQAASISAMEMEDNKMSGFGRIMMEIRDLMRPIIRASFDVQQRLTRERTPKSNQYQSNQSNDHDFHNGNREYNKSESYNR